MRHANDRRYLPVLLLALLAGAAAAADKKPLYDEKWLDSLSWPKFLAPFEGKPGPKDDAATRLLKERYGASQEELRSLYIYWLQSGAQLAEVCEAAARASEARLDLEGARADRLALLRERAEFARLVEAQAKVIAARSPRTARHQLDRSRATYYRATAELGLLRAEKAVKGEPSK
jgi:hypothetical protein